MSGCWLPPRWGCAPIMGPCTCNGAVHPPWLAQCSWHGRGTPSPGRTPEPWRLTPTPCIPRSVSEALIHAFLPAGGSPLPSADPWCRGALQPGSGAWPGLGSSEVLLTGQRRRAKGAARGSSCLLWGGDLQ